jgi:hypothetical protein
MSMIKPKEKLPVNRLGVMFSEDRSIFNYFSYTIDFDGLLYNKLRINQHQLKREDEYYIYQPGVS